MKDDYDWVKKCMEIIIEGGGLLKDLLLSIYGPFSDRVGLPIHNIISPFHPVIDVISINF